MIFNLAPLAAIAALALALVLASAVGAAVRHTSELPSSFVVTAASGGTTATGGVRLRASDLNGDGAVNQVDLSELVKGFGRVLGQGSGADMNGDHTVDVLDLAVVGRNFGATLNSQE